MRVSAFESSLWLLSFMTSTGRRRKVLRRVGRRIDRFCRSDGAGESQSLLPCEWNGGGWEGGGRDEFANFALPTTDLFVQVSPSSVWIFALGSHL